ncbi:MAG: maleylpyruvate isomerase family mycothiol-dependent enzyme [Kineosporiaceae bacterium]
MTEAPSAAHARPRARVVLLVGASGSGKTRLGRVLGLPTVALDDFYREIGDPALPSTDPAAVDWDDPASWDPAAALDALARLCHGGAVEVPRYDIASSRRTGRHTVSLDGARVVVAEGVFAAELAAPLARELLLADAVCLRRHRLSTFARRLARDLVEARKDPLTLVRRGVRLARAEPAMRSRWVARGCRPESRDGALAAATRLVALRALPPARLNPHVDLLAELRAATGAFAAGLAAADLAAPVAACPGWTVRDLAWHLGGGDRWARTAAVEGRGDGDAPTGPDERDALVAWYRQGADALVEALASRDASDPAWTLAPPRTVGFWVRRRAHETAVHLWDLQAAAGEAQPLGTRLAADAVDEVVTTMWPRQVRKGRAGPPPEPVLLVAADTGQRWLLGDPTGAAITAPASALALLLWGRLGLADPAVRVDGERAVAETALDRAVTP